MGISLFFERGYTLLKLEKHSLGRYEHSQAASKVSMK